MCISKFIFTEAIKYLEEYDSTIVYKSIESGNKKRKIRLAIKNLERSKNKQELEKTRQACNRGSK